MYTVQIVEVRMLEKIINIGKTIFGGGKPFLRIMRIFRYVTCIIVLFTLFCDSYWNLLDYVDFPCVPLFGEKFRATLHSSGIGVFVIFVIYSETNWNVILKRWQMIVTYIENVLNFVFTMYFLLYATNLCIEHANGVPINIWIEAVISVIYLVQCAVVKSLVLHRKQCEQMQVRYTGYCDCGGCEIPIEGIVFYKGKGYKVVKHEGIYRLLPCGERIISSKLIALEDAVADQEGHLLLRK